MQIGVSVSIYDQEKHKVKEAKNSEEEDGEEEVSPLQVGHNVYILAYKLSEHRKELKEALRKAENDEAIKYYAKRTAQIEVCI